MKKKVVLRVEMCCDRCRTKALETVASIDGVLSVALEGAERNMVVVVGEGMDPVTITKKLRKKAGHTELVKVEAISRRDGMDNEDEHRRPAAVWNGYPAVWNGYPPSYIASCQACEVDHPTVGCSIV